MDPLDPGRARLDGLRCAVCDGSVPPDAVQTLAWREGLTFAQITCEACSSSTLAILVDGFAVDGSIGFEGVPDDAPPVSADDVLAMHALLRDWRGGLRELVDRTGSTGSSSAS